MVNVNDILGNRPNNLNTFAGASLGIHCSPAADNHSASFDITTLTPFGNIHTISGLFHNHKIFLSPVNGDPTSGVLRFSQAARDFQISVDGGLTFLNLSSTEVASLQEAYVNGPNIIIDSTGNDLILTSNSAKVKFAHAGNFYEARVSGLIPLHTNVHELGDLTFLLHSQVVQNMAGVATPAEATARSLGIGTLALNTGSGIINISVGSGIGEYANSGGAQTIATGAATNIVFTNDIFTDQNFAHAESLTATGNQIAIMSSGLYKCTYNISWEQTSSAAPITLKYDATLNSVAIIPSASYSFSFDADHGKATNSAIFLFEARPGDVLRMRAQRQANVLDTAQFVQDESWVIVEKIGPQTQ